MKQPLGIAALLYLTGLLIADFIQLPLTLLFSVSITISVIAIFISKTRGLLIWPLVLLTGWTNLAWHTAIVSPHDLRTILDGSYEDVVVRGVLNETPSARPSGNKPSEIARTFAVLDVTAIRRSDGWRPASGQVMAITRGALGAEYFAGQPVEVGGIISFPPLPLAQGLFDYRSYLSKQCIYFQLRSLSTNEWRLSDPHRTKPPPSDRFLRWAKSTLARGLPEEDQNLRLLWAMTLGGRNALPNDVYEPFIESGTMHIFAISGLHIALIAGILVAVLRVVQISRFWCGAIVIPLIWFYAAATGWQPSAIRATIMMTIIVGGWALKRPSNLLNSLAVAAFVILLWEPQQLFQAGFQLSFFVVLSIALILPPLEKLRDRLLQTEPLRPVELSPLWQRALRPVLRWLTTAAAVSLAAWLGAWPLTVSYFHIFSPVTLLANLLIVPLASATLASCVGSLFFGALLPWISELFNHSAWFWMNCMTGISRWAAGLPNAFLYVPSLNPVDFIIYYAVLFGTLTGWLFSRKGRMLTIASLVVVGSYYLNRGYEARHSMTLTAIPLDGGSAVYCDAPGRANDLLVDCGNTNSFRQVLKPWLRSQGVNSITYLLLSHGDLRNIGGTEPLCDTVRVRNILTTAVPFRSPTYRRIVQDFSDQQKPLTTVHLSDRIGGWTLLHPLESDDFSQADDNAMVLSGDFYGTRVLLLSDLGKPGQNALMEREQDLRADIVISGLPEQSEPLSDALLDAIQPKVIVVVDSERPATKRASLKLLTRLADRDVAVFSTRYVGAVTINLTRRGWELRTSAGKLFTEDTIPPLSPPTRLIEPEEDAELPDER